MGNAREPLTSSSESSQGFEADAELHAPFHDRVSRQILSESASLTVPSTRPHSARSREKKLTGHGLKASLPYLALEELSQLAGLTPKMDAALYGEAASRLDALRYKPSPREGNARLGFLSEVLNDLTVCARTAACFGQDYVHVYQNYLVKGTTSEQALGAVFNQVIAVTDKAAQARITGTMLAHLPGTLARRSAVALDGVAPVFAQSGLREALRFAYFMLDILTTAPAAGGETVNASSPTMRDFEETTQWAYGHRNSILHQCEMLQRSTTLLTPTPLNDAVRLSVALDHVAAFATLIDLPQPHEFYGRRMLFIALGLTMDAGAVRCAKWLLDRGVRMMPEAMVDLHNQVDRAHNYLRHKACAVGPITFIGHMHQLRLEVARLCLAANDADAEVPQDV